MDQSDSSPEAKSDGMSPGAKALLINNLFRGGDISAADKELMMNDSEFA